MKKTIFKVMIPKNAPDLDEAFGSPKQGDKARLILQHMFKIRLMLKQNKNFAPGINKEMGWCPVSSKSLKSMLGDEYKAILDKLMELKIIEVQTNPVTGKKNYAPKLYSLKYRVLLGVGIPNDPRKYRVEKITDPKIAMKIRYFYRKQYRNQIQELQETSEWYLPNLKFIDDLYLDEAVFDFASTQGAKSDYLIGVSNEFNNGTGKFVVKDKFAGRIHTHICALPKILRPFLRHYLVKGPLLIADVKSAQPFLLSALFYKPELIHLIPEFAPVLDKLLEGCSKPDIRMFYEACSSATFYPNWMELIQLEKDEAKKKLFQHVLYSSASNQHKDQNVKEERLRTRFAFKSMYPNVYATLNALKQTRQKTLPFVFELTKKGKKRGRMFVTPNMMAQRIEVAILLNRISKQCCVEGMDHCTIHDAWIFKKSDQDKFTEIFSDSFKNLGIKAPKLAIEELKARHNNIELLNSGK